MKILYNNINSKKDFKHFREWYFLCTNTNTIKKKEYKETLVSLGKI